MKTMGLIGGMSLESTSAYYSLGSRDYSLPLFGSAPIRAAKAVESSPA